MRFLKSITRSIRRPPPHHPDDEHRGAVSEFGLFLPDETAGIKRPSGHGDIARRERRRSSSIGPVSPQDDKEPDRMDSAILAPALASHTDISNVTPETLTHDTQSYPDHDALAHSPQSSAISLPLAPLSPVPSFRPKMPHGIIITPSSPRKTDTKRYGPFSISGSSSHVYDAFDSTTSLSTPGNDAGISRESQSVSPASTLSDPLEQSAKHLGMGRPVTGLQHLQSTTSLEPSSDGYRFDLLTVDAASSPLILSHRSSSLPAQDRQKALSQPNSPQFRSISFTSNDDGRLGTQTAGNEDRSSRKTIRKTRSFSDVLSRNRKPRTDSEIRTIHKPLITWNSTKQPESADLSADNAPLAVSPTLVPKKKGGSLLKSAVDLFQFRKSRSEVSSDTGKQESLASAVPEVNLQQVSLDEPESRAINAESADVGDTGRRAQIDAGRSGDLKLQAQVDPSPSGRSKPNQSSRSRSGTTTSMDGDFKRPHIGPRAQSTNSAISVKKSQGPVTDPQVWHSSRAPSEISVSRSTTIKAVNAIRPPRSTPDMSTPSVSSSARNSRQNSVDGFGSESDPISILRSNTPVQTPPLHPLPGSPSVSFAGGTPRISISSTSSQIDSGTINSPSRRYTSTSQENVHSGIPYHNSTSSRPRSSTLFSAAPAWLASNTIASPDKKRSTLMRRLSAGLIGSFDDASKRQSFRTSPQESNSPGAEYFDDSGQSIAAAPDSSPPEREPGETTRDWMTRLSQISKRSELAAILASRQDPCFQEALDLLLGDFMFNDLPLDIGLRVFLRQMALPSEAQQIDRVLEAFAKRYNACHPGLFRDTDHAYILAFSLIMLHTDVHNRNNKQKMTKAEYVRNTRLEGVSPAVLEVFHENTCHSEFLFAGSANGLGDLSYSDRPRTHRRSSLFFQTKASQDALAYSGPDKAGCRLQAAVAKGDISQMQIPSSRWIPKEDPMSYIGSWNSLDHQWAEKSFQLAPAIEVVKPAASSRTPENATTTVLRLKIVKAGLLSRKDEVVQMGKKINHRKWRSWSVILTNTQLIFLKDTIWALALNEQIERLETATTRSPGTLLLPTFTDFKPEEVIGLTECAAVFDRSYSKYDNTFRLAMPHGREHLLQANGESDMNEWVSLINWSAASKTLGIPTSSRSAPPDDSCTTPPNNEDNQLAVEVGRCAKEAERQPLQASSQDPQTAIASHNVGFVNKPLMEQYEARSRGLVIKIKEELRLARNLELLVIISRSSQEHITSLLLLMAENIRRWRAELARLNSIHIRDK